LHSVQTLLPYIESLKFAVEVVLPADMKRYPEGWKEFSHWIRFVRSGRRCECGGQCGLHKTNPGPRRCKEVHGERAVWAKGKVILTVAHLCDCNPPCKNPEHVIAACQRCHLRIDQKLHTQNRLKNSRLRREAAGQLTMEVASER